MSGAPREGGRRIRVLHVLYTMAYGGVETTVINWIRSLDPQRYDVYLTCFALPGEAEMPFVRAAERVAIPVVAKIGWRRSKPIFSATRELRDLARRLRIDIIHSHNCYADLLALLVRTLVPVRLVTTLYVWGDFGWKRNLLQWINELAIRRFDLISAHCEVTREQTIARGFRPDDVRLLISGFQAHPCNLTPAERERRRSEMGVKKGETVLVNVARFYPEKAQDGLLRTFREILKEHPGTWLWMLGVGPLENQLRKLADELGVAGRVRFLGFVEDLPALLALVDIQVHPSHMEGVAIAICSGMAAGLPIVASRVGGLPEVLKNDRTGVLIEPGDESAFGKAVSRLIRQPEEARRVGKAAREFIETEYSLERAAADLGRAYLEVMRPCT